MNNYFCISVTFLDTYFHGRGDDNLPEWPPSPLRIFQAMLAGSLTGYNKNEWSLEKEKAFQRLENLSAPLIIAPPVEKASEYKIFVPDNIGDREDQKSKMLCTKYVRPLHIINKNEDVYFPTIHYLWEVKQSDIDSSKNYIEILKKEVRNIYALGWGIDQSFAIAKVLTTNEVLLLNGDRWIPQKTSSFGLKNYRIPCNGSLEDLRQKYANSLERIKVEKKRRSFSTTVKSINTKPTVFEKVCYCLIENLPMRNCAEFELEDGKAFRQEDICKVAKILRLLAYKIAKNDSHLFPGGVDKYIAGHGETKENGKFINEPFERFSYLPLPSIGHQNADGMIRRFIIAEPFGGDGSNAKWAKLALTKNFLYDEKGNEYLLTSPWRKSSTNVFKLYLGGNDGSKEWVSVTPVILPGFDDGKIQKAEKLFLRCFEQAGLKLEILEGFILRKAPFHSGSLHPNCYRRPDYLDVQTKSHFSSWHVRLIFRGKVHGPLSLGAGRHLGLGLFSMA